MKTPDVTVIGAGAIGVLTALELAERGATVTLIERGTVVAAGCSAGNAGLVGSRHVLPLPSADSVREGLRLMLRAHGAFSLRPRPATVPWLAGFLLAARDDRYRRSAALLASLAQESLAGHRALGERLDTGYAERGLLAVFETEAAFAATPTAADNRRLSGAEAVAACPQLAVEPAAAIVDPSQAHCDPEQFIRAVAEEAVRRGVEIRTGVEILELCRSGERVTSMLTTAGEVAVGEVVIANGAWAPQLTRGLGVRVPIQGGKGYHVDFAAASGDPEQPIYLGERKMVITPMDGHLRVTGTLELAGTDMTVDQHRVAGLIAQVSRQLRGFADRPVKRVWRGLRPCTPDGLPMIGRLPAVPNVTLAAGHGMWGLQLAPVTGTLVADLLTGRPDQDRLEPLRPGRFSWTPRSRRAMAAGHETSIHLNGGHQ